MYGCSSQTVDVVLIDEEEPNVEEPPLPLQQSASAQYEETMRIAETFSDAIDNKDLTLCEELGKNFISIQCKTTVLYMLDPDFDCSSIADDEILFYEPSLPSPKSISSVDACYAELSAISQKSFCDRIQDATLKRVCETN